MQNQLVTRDKELEVAVRTLSSREGSLQELKQSLVTTNSELVDKTNKLKKTELLLVASGNRIAEITEQQKVLIRSTARELDSLRDAMASISELRDEQARIIVSRDSVIKEISDSLQLTFTVSPKNECNSHTNGSNK